MSEISDLFKEWDELNTKAGESMGQFDFSKIKEIRKEQSNIENAIFEIVKKHASEDILNILPENCGELEMGYNASDEVFYFVMIDPEFEDEEEIKLLAVAIDVNNNVSLINDFKIEE
ncbi:MAG: hypothetical protein EAX91_10025 [Candidatus Lokiarchaeota archaeon]|nr:hypothetical protein [Candidatus Lokiarchaeota archaeon]